MIITDLHIHSQYSRAVSPQMEPPIMAQWAGRKGINLLGSGDFTHPLWLRGLESQLREVNEGIYQLKTVEQIAGGHFAPVNFLITGEISCIYSQGGKIRKIHLVVLIPSFKVAYKINQELEDHGFNLVSDGRPILGFSARDLVELLKGVDKRIAVIPAHIWTPWFGLYGSRSGFDSLAECFGDMGQYIHAIETGLSSDPAMNWQIRELDSRQIVSFSDAHSPQKLGREMTVLKRKDNGDKSFSFADVAEALEDKSGSQWKIAYTVEFYPQEGKYHYSGHRRCGVCQSPEETQKLGTTCPVCGKPLTLGVMHQVQLTVKSPKLKVIEEIDGDGVRWIKSSLAKNCPPYVTLVPLLEVLSESLNCGVSSQKVVNEYNNLTVNLGSELEILLRRKGKEIEKMAGWRVSEAIAKMRGGDINIEPGFDGQFGRVQIFGRQEKQERKQMGLF